MRVFITGGTSFLGSHLVKHLQMKGHELSLLVRDPSRFPWLQDCLNAQVVEGDLVDVGKWSETLKEHDVLIHNALLWDEEPTELEMADVRAAALVFEAAAKAGIGQIIYTSSAAVHRPWKTLMSEDDRLLPETTYGATKAANEAFLSALSCQLGFRFTVIRPGAVVGAPAYSGGAFKCDSRLSSMVAQAKSGEPIAVRQGDARQFVGAADLARVYQAVLEQGCHNRTYLAVDERHTQWVEIADRLVGLTGSGSEIKVELPEASAWRLNVNRLKEELGITLDSRIEMSQALSHLAQSSQS